MRMTSEDPPVDPPSLAEEWRDHREQLSTRERVYAVALQLHEPTRVAAVAERANVSKETAREYLKWFTEIEMLTHNDESPDRFSRNEEYFKWRRIQQFQSQSFAELEQELKGLSSKEREYRERYDVDSPDAVDALDHADYDEIEEVWMDVQEWRTVRRRIRELERARRNQDESTNTEAPA
jgi:predicted ArsR family transcriptional regulator